jgi:hypothetical protein
LSQVKQEINAGRPIVAGISPSGYMSQSNVSEHVALIVGYDGVLPQTELEFSLKYVSLTKRRETYEQETKILFARTKG